MIRLFGLLCLLALGFVAVPLLPSKTSAPQAQPQIATLTPASDKAAPQLLPATVRRLAEAPVAAPLGPVVFGDALPIPTSVALSAPDTPTDPSFRQVKAQRANVRSGPSTNYQVVGSLAAGDEVKVVDDAGNGWLMVRVEGDGIEGWIAASLLRR